jgi:Tol biopolymer transport system component
LLLTACGDSNPTNTVALVATATVATTTSTTLATNTNPTTKLATVAQVTTAVPTTVANTTVPATTLVTNTNKLATVTQATVQLTTTVATIALPQLDAKAEGILVYDKDGDIWVLSLPEGTRNQLTKDGAAARQIDLNHNPVWSPDNLQIAFASARDLYQQPNYKQGYEVYLMRPDGSNLKRLTQSADSLSVNRTPIAWLPTGDILVRQTDMNNNSDTGKIAPIVLLDPNNGNIKPLPIKAPDLNIYGPITISPDKTQLAFINSKADSKPGYSKVDLFVAPLIGNGSPIALTNFPPEIYASISALTWSPDGQTIAFLTAIGDGCGAYTIYTVDKAAGTPRQLFTESGKGVPTTLSYAPKGKWITYGTYGGCIPEDSSKIRLLDTEKGGSAAELTEGSNPSYGRKVRG